MLGCPSAPPASVEPAHENELIPAARVMLFPAASALFAVTVTTAPLDVAITDDAAALRLIASLRFVAIVVVSADVAKFDPVLEPSFPPVRLAADQSKPVRL